MQKNLQYKRTDRDIMDAFIKLLQMKPFEKIIIQDIMDEAMVNRSTFYNHFKDKYEIAEKLQANYMDKYIRIMDGVNKKTSVQYGSIRELIQSYFIENRAVLKLLIKIRTEKVDIVSMWNEFYQKAYLTNADSPEAVIEARIYSNIYITFMTYYIENDSLLPDYSKLFFDVFMNVAMNILMLENDKEIRAIILNRIMQNPSDRTQNPT